MVSATIMVMMEGEDGEMMEETKVIGMGMTDAMGNFILTTMGNAEYIGKEIMFMVMEEGMESMDAMPSMMMDDGSMMGMDDPSCTCRRPDQRGPGSGRVHDAARRHHWPGDAARSRRPPRSRRCRR